MTLRFAALLFAAAALGFAEINAQRLSILGKYIAYLHKVYACEPGAATDAINVHLVATRFDKAHPFEMQRITGNLTMDRFDDTMWLNMRLDSRSNNDWKENAFVFNFPTSACSSLYDNVPDFARVAFASPKPTPCAKQGFFQFKDQAINWTFPNVPVMPYGFWRLRFSTGPRKAKQASICVNVECYTIAQPKRSGG